MIFLCWVRLMKSRLGGLLVSFVLEFSARFCFTYDSYE